MEQSSTTSGTPGPLTGSEDLLPITASDRRVVAALEEYMKLQDGPCPPDRAAFLAGHPEIASELAPCLDGLAFVRSAARLMATPIAEASPARTEAAIPPATRMGEFQIVRMLGRGGMGVVYEAEQLPLGRRVALKVLPSAAALDPIQQQRFRVEAQAAALLQHPHIVPVFAVGSDQGAHFYAMQFIAGRTLAAVIRDLSRREQPDADASSSDLSVTGEWSARGPARFRAVARWGLQAAGALEHAHGLGVLHRDIKPANLMIDGQSELWVMDFGLARLRGEHGLTRTGERVGTLRYMSPEQALARRGDLDHRTDIYSLGLTLYELIALRPAFDGEDPQELLRQIATAEPPGLRGLEPAVPRDLETIVLKAVAKDPDDRYATAGALADDLRRFLDDEPIRARRPTPVERLARWARRRRKAVIAAAAVVLACSLLGSAVLGVGFRRALANNERARQSLRRSFAVTDALAFDGMHQLASFEKDRRSGEFYIGALPYFQEIAAMYEDDPEMREMAAAAYHRVGFVQGVLRHIKQHPDFLAVDPEIACRRSVELYEAEIAAKPADTELRAAMLSTLTDLASLQNMAGRREEAERTCRRVIEIRRTLAGEPDGPLLLAYDLAMHGQFLELLGRHDAANDALRESDELWTALASAADPVDRERNVEVARTGNQIGLVLANLDQERADHVLSLARKLDPEDPALLNNQAWQLVKRSSATTEQARQAVDLSRRAAASSPGRWELWNTLGVAQLRAGDPRSAIDALNRGMALHFDGDPSDWLPLAMALWQSGDREGARARYDQSVEWIGRHPDKLDLDMIRLWSEAARLLGMPVAPFLESAADAPSRWNCAVPAEALPGGRP